MQGVRDVGDDVVADHHGQGEDGEVAQEAARRERGQHGEGHGTETGGDQVTGDPLTCDRLTCDPLLAIARPGVTEC